MLHPRPQTNRENCTWHNFNVVPTKAGYYATVGSYQSGISVFDFSNPAAPREIAYADPAPLTDRAAHHGHRPRRRLVDLLAQRLHLRVRHQARRHHVAAEPRRRRHRDAGQRAPEAHEHVRAVEPADAERVLRARAAGPTITVASPVEGARSRLGSTIVADFDCADNAAVESCVGTVADGETMTNSRWATRCSGSRRSTPPATSPPRTSPTWSTASTSTLNAGTGTVDSAMALTLPARRRRTSARSCRAVFAREYLRDGRAADHVDGRRPGAHRLRPATTATGRLVNGAARSPARCRSTRQRHAGDRRSRAATSAARRLRPRSLSFARSATNRAVTLTFRQPIAANGDPPQRHVRQDADVHAQHHDP